MTPWFSLTDMPRQSAPVAPPTPPRYEEALAELERLVQRMEDGQLPLDQLLDNYRRGAELLESCRARLAAIEEQVKVLEDGQLKPWISGASGA
jgi:exodeoxyribonuclease VII small subunit